MRRRQQDERSRTENWVEMGTLIRDPQVMRFELVEELPAACGGGVVVPDDVDGATFTLLLEPPCPTCVPADLNLDEWSEVCYAALAQGEMITCADQAERFGVSVEVAHAAFWVAAIEWWIRRVCPHAS